MSSHVYKDSAGNEHVIHVNYSDNPTPKRDWDYISILDSYDGAPDAGPQLMGCGKNEEEALNALILQIEDEL